MAFFGADDLCSVVSTISSTFTAFDDEGGNDDSHHDPDPPEMKYIPSVPPTVKTEILENAGNVTEDDIDDEFINRFFDDVADNCTSSVDGAQTTSFINKSKTKRRGEHENENVEGGANDGTMESETSCSTRGRKGLRRRETIMVKVEHSDDSANDADDNYDIRDEEWGPGDDDMDDEWRPSKKEGQSGRKRKTRRKVTLDGRGKGRGRVKGRKNAEDSGPDIDVKVEGFENTNDKSKPVRKKKFKRVSEMTPEEAEKERARSRARRAKAKEEREAMKGDATGESDTSAPPKRRKKRISEMTPEEAARMRAQWSAQKRKRISDMTPEQAEKERARWREKRNRERERQRLLKEAIKNDLTGESDTSSIMSSVTFGRRKKRISEMTPEERQAAQEAWRRQHEKRKARRATMPPEKREAEKARARERQRLRRQLAKEGALPEDQLRSIEEQYRKDRERKRARRAAMTPEEKREEMQRNEMYRIARKARMSEEEKQARRMRNYMQCVARQAAMTPEEIERRKQQRREYGMKRYQKLKETLGAEGIRQMRRNYWHSMTPERKEKALAKLRECHRRRVQKLKEEGRWEEVKKIWNERDKSYKKKRREMGNPIPKKRKPKTKTETEKRKDKGEKRTYTKKWSEMTEEEKERKKEQRKNYIIRRKLAIQRLLDSGMTMEEIHQQTETPAQREQRLIRQRIRKAKTNLRKRLENVGAPPEEIEKKVEELKHTYQPTYSFRPYKPRPHNWRRIDPSEIPKNLDGVNIGSRPISAPLLPEKPREERIRAKKPTVKKEPREASPPRKRGRPFKYPRPPEQATVTSSSAASSSTSTITNAQSGTATIVTHTPSSVTVVKEDAAISQQAAAVSVVQRHHYQPPSTSQHSSSTSGTPVLFTHQQQHQYSQFNTPSYYQNPPPPLFQYPHQQPQVPPPPVNLQHILDGIAYQQEMGAATTSAPLIPSHASSYHYDTTSTTSSQHEYSGSYYGDDTHSPPPTSPGGGFEDSYSDYSYSQPEQLTVQHSQSNVQSSSAQPNNPTESLSSSSQKPKKPRVRKYYYRPPKNPNAKLRTKQKDVIRNAVCDQCGQAYNRLSLRSHKNQLHNPNYDIENRKCRICGETYKHAQRWYSHYLKEHVKPFKPNKKVFMCEQCGEGFANAENYRKHEYYVHGDGLKKENFIKCPICPDERLFKEKMSYHSHLARAHPDYVRPGHDCYRCEKSYPNEKVLAEHVKTSHPDSYFPCPYCTAVKFTQLGLQFHFTRCFKITKEQRNELKSKCTGLWTLELMPASCDICGRQVMVSSMSRHYREVHNVIDDRFACHFENCKKPFRSRGFWANHLYEKHQLEPEKVKEIVRKLVTPNRESIQIEPKKYTGRGGDRRTYGGEKAKKNQRGKKRRKKKLSDDEEDDGSESEQNDSWNSFVSDAESEDTVKRKRKKKRRKIIVIAEEDLEKEK